MKLYGISYVCSLCNGEALVKYTDAHFLFTSDFFHRDPRVCKENIEAEQRKKQNEAPA